MKKYEALGVVETQYFTIAMELLDQMLKSADVEFLASEKYLGGRLVTLIVGGSISDVTMAVEAAKMKAEGKEHTPLKMALVITNPHPEIMKYIVPSLKNTEQVEKSDAEQVKAEKPKAE
jgi:microcompartment protein CcmL/EutN